jgi:two-component system chemotaxis response regulator CheB
VQAPLRILLVDDSALARRMLRELLEGDPGISVVGEAVDGRDALARVAELRPDLVLLDVRMPVMDGVETTRQLMAYHPTPILVLTASLNSYDVDITFKMLGAGALDVMEKPALGDPAAIERCRQLLVRKINLLARVKVVTHLRGRRQNAEVRVQHAEAPVPPRSTAAAASFTSQRARPSALTIQHSAFPVVAIGASTGGPRVVRQILSALPATFPAAVLVIQHIAQGFSAGMVEWLAASTALPVVLAAEGDSLRPSTVVVAPDRFDLLVQSDGTFHLSGLPLLLQRPAIDIAMQSLAVVYGANAIGVLLTGMGRDGARGLQAIKRVGGYTIAQDEASSTIYGMPRAAVELGVAQAVLPPHLIAEALIERIASIHRS